MNQYNGRQTIFALSSGKVPAGVAVIRVSGPDTALAVCALAGELPPPRIATLRKITASDGRHVDTALVLWFPGPASFTGEDCAEFQCHGGPAVVTAVLGELSKLTGCRLADAGEFSLRAFTNGKADLTQMEALADLIDAETETQRMLAIAGTTGAQKNLYENWRKDLLKARAFLEADLDFSDEDDVPGSVAAGAAVIVERMLAGIRAHLKTASAAEIIRDGFRVVIAGAPNSGKSTLLNTLAKRDVAIVTDIAGTTRDVLEVSLDLGGIKVIICDTAGLRDTSDKIELMGIERAHAAIGNANLVLLLSDNAHSVDIDAHDLWTVTTKADLDSEKISTSKFLISCASGQGIEILLEAIEASARQSLGDLNEGEIVSRVRHKALVQNACEALMRFEELEAGSSEFAAEELRVAAECLARITGVISTEDVLGAIFSSFCIGK